MRNFKAIAFLFCATLFVSSAAAQEWTKDQQELWKYIESTWEMWKDGNIEGTLATFHDTYLGWSSDEPMPVDKAKITKSWNMMKDNYKVHYFDLVPVRINIVGNAAVAHYYFEMYANMMGKEESLKGKNTEFYIKEGGKWMLLGDHTSMKMEKEDDD